MKLYYYAFSGHKWGLDRVKRGVALIKLLRKEGIDVQLLVSDFRAGLVAKDFGVAGSVTVEGIMDVDVIAKNGDIVFLDTPESDNGRIEMYSKEYKALFNIVDDDNIKSTFGEYIISPNGELSSVIIDEIYFNIEKKEDRILFFLGDSDYNKTILSQKDFFENRDMELILGNYFFVKYENDLAKIFKTLHEPEEYEDLIRTSSIIVTASIQTALEARACEAKTIYINDGNESQSVLEKLKEYDIIIINGFNQDDLLLAVNDDRDLDKKVTYSSKEIAIKVKNKLNL
jgi:hypothetical protein